MKQMYTNFMNMLQEEYVPNMKAFQKCMQKKHAEFHDNSYENKGNSASCGEMFWHTLIECTDFFPMEWGGPIFVPDENETKFCRKNHTADMCVSICHMIMLRMSNELIPQWDDATPNSICYLIKQENPDAVPYRRKLHEKMTKVEDMDEEETEDEEVAEEDAEMEEEVDEEVEEEMEEEEIEPEMEDEEIEEEDEEE